MKAYPGLPADGNVEAWLVTIAHRKAIDVTHTRARRAIPVAETPDTATAPRRDLELDGDLAGALAALPPKQKQAVAYHYLAGLPYTDVAAILGGSIDAARRGWARPTATGASSCWGWACSPWRRWRAAWLQARSCWSPREWRRAAPRR
jgi:RNA polymerase sigma factor (sigma-70 family)